MRKGLICRRAIEGKCLHEECGHDRPHTEKDSCTDANCASEPAVCVSYILMVLKNKTYLNRTVIKH